MNLVCVSRELHPRRSFRISRGRRNAVRNVFVRLEHQGVTGYGEASPNSFYEETWEGVTAKLEAARAWLATLEIRSVADLEAAWSEAWPLLAPSRAAQCALDLALWDWLARRERVSAAELAWGRKPEPVTTFCTIGLSTPEELAAKVEEMRGFPRIKLKSDQEAGIDPIRYVRERSEALLAVDANCAWRTADICALSRELAQFKIEFIEQPLPPAQDALLRPRGGCLPLIADESCVTEDDVERVARLFDGFNIKLVKCGGLTPARRMVRRGRELGCKLMVGCMLESSALIAAGAVIAQQTDYADLDGAWLIGDDPFRGWDFDRGVLAPSGNAGLGVEPEPALFGAG
ncbi:MAG: L-Ala-D/L-Glu epimerase [Chthoniobacter sp.]|nr:L-Ala-D/L-Glu epimerase [Chthoniobacter sp.]